MKIRIIEESDFSITDWSGGKTTEMFLYPEGSSYQEKNFLFRISSATVDAEESVFTRLDGIHRQIVLLNGSMVLQHEQGVPVTLYPYVPHSFEGSWKTVSRGRAQDFNLMYRNCRAGLRVISDTGRTVFERMAGMDFFYSSECDFRIEQQTIKHGQLAMVTGQSRMVQITTALDHPGVIHVFVDLYGEEESVTTGV